MGSQSFDYDDIRKRFSLAPKTKAKMVACWVDGPQPSMEGLDRWCDDLAAVYGCAIIVTNTGQKPFWKPRWSKSKLAKATAGLKARGVQVQWMVWPYAQTPALTSTVLWLKDYYAHCKATQGCYPDAVNLDLEGRHNSLGWGPAGSILAAGFVTDLLSIPGMQLTVTTIVPIRSMRKQDVSVLHAIVLLQLKLVWMPQAYSQYQPKKKWTHNSMFRPGPVQRHCAEEAYELLDRGMITECWLGQMVGFQNHPKPYPRGVKALEVAFKTGLDSGFDVFPVWSKKLVRGKTKKFLKDIQGGKVIQDNLHLKGVKTRSTFHLVRGVQSLLINAGYKPGKADGILGPRTKYALKAFEEDRGYLADGELDFEVLSDLVAMSDGYSFG